MSIIQQIELLPVKCDNQDHSKQVCTMCLKIDCNKPSAQCIKCTLALHAGCFEYIKTFDEIPLIMEPLFQIQSILLQDLTMMINQQLKMFKGSIEQNLSPIIEYKVNPSLSNLNKLGLFLKEESQWNIGNNIDNCEKEIKRIFEDCKMRIKSKVSLYKLLVWKQNTQSFKEWYDQGEALRKLYKFEEANDCYQQAISIDPKYVNAWNYKGVTLYKLEQYDEAIKCYDQAITLDSKNVNAWFNKGIALDNLKQYEKAKHCYEEVINLDPQYVDAWNNKGVALYNLKEYQQAIRFYSLAINLNPNYVNAWKNKGQALQELQKYQEAENCFERVKILDPKQNLAMDNFQLKLAFLQ